MNISRGPLRVSLNVPHRNIAQKDDALIECKSSFTMASKESKLISFTSEFRIVPMFCILLNEGRMEPDRFLRGLGSIRHLSYRPEVNRRTKECTCRVGFARFSLARGVRSWNLWLRIDEGFFPEGIANGPLSPRNGGNARDGWTRGWNLFEILTGGLATECTCLI